MQQSFTEEQLYKATLFNINQATNKIAEARKNGNMDLVHELQKSRDFDLKTALDLYEKMQKQPKINNNMNNQDARTM